MERITFILLVAAVTLLTYVNYQQKEHLVYYEEYIELLNQYHEDQIDIIINQSDSNDYLSTDTIPFTAIIGDWKFTNDSIEYVGQKDTVFVVDIDSLQNKYKYYRLVIEPHANDKIKFMTVCYGDYDNWKKREVNGTTQYSLDGTNWFEL